MANIPVEEARANLDDLIARVAQGEEFIITKDQKPVARLVGQKNGRSHSQPTEETKKRKPLPPFPDENDLTDEQIDRDFALLEQLCSTSDPDDEARMAQLLESVRAEAKEQVRRQMGLGK